MSHSEESLPAFSEPELVERPQEQDSRIGLDDEKPSFGQLEGGSPLRKKQHAASETSRPSDDQDDLGRPNVSWQFTVFNMIAEQIALGTLSLPGVFRELGMLGGIIVLLFFSILTLWASYVMHLYRQRHPWINNITDVGYILWGNVGRELITIMLIFFLIFLAASHVVSGAIALNVLTDHATCSVVFSTVTAIVSLLLTLPKTLDSMSKLGVASFLSITAGVMVVVIAAGVQAQGKDIDWHWLPQNTSFAGAFLAVSSISFSYGGTCNYFHFMAEMRNPDDWPKALYVTQFISTAIYMLTGALVYRFAGNNVTSPALGSVSPLMAKVGYGLCMPVIIIAGVVNAHIGAKVAYRRLHGVHRFGLADGSYTYKIVVWAGLCSAVWLIAFVIAEVIPYFTSLLGVIASIFMAWFTYSMMGILGLHLDKPWKRAEKMGRDRLFGIRTLVNIALVVIGAILCFVGLWTSIQSIVDLYGATEIERPFGCDNNLG